MAERKKIKDKINGRNVWKYEGDENWQVEDK